MEVKRKQLMNIVVYIHGKGGNINEAKHYRQLFPAYDVIGIDYKSSVPWEAREEIHNAILDLKEKYEKIFPNGITECKYRSGF